jgi:predicted permease
MPDLFLVYVRLFSWILVGWFAGRFLPLAVPIYLGKFLFWIGVPIGVLAFLRHAQVSWSLWLAPACAWLAILLGSSLAWTVLHARSSATHVPEHRTRGSFLLAAMLGNTGYIGFPVSLALVGSDQFAWALFYDLLGSTPGAYGLGVAIAARFGSHAVSGWQSLRTLLQNPTLWSFGVGLWGRNWPLPALIESGLSTLGWSMVALALLLVGMRLSQLHGLRTIQPALVSVGIKMLVVPLVVGTGLWLLGIRGPVHRVLLLQMAMPPAFATLVLAEAYELDSELAVTAIAIGTVGLLGLLPFWLWLFGDPS